MLLKDAETRWVLIPHSIVDNKVVYKKCRVKGLVEKFNQWSDETQAMYADFVYDKNEGLVTLNELTVR